MRVAVLMNRGSGTKRGRVTPDQVAALFAEAGVDATVQAVAPKRFAVTLKAMASSGCDAVVAAGGDGTVSAVAGALAGTGVPMGVLPVGTLNHFAKDAGIPLKLEDAVRTIADGVAQAVDVAEVNGRVFVNNSSVGIYALAVKIREYARCRKGIGKWRAMFGAALRVFRRFPLLFVRIEAGDEVTTRRTPLVFIGNNSYDIELFGLGRRQSLDNGSLCVYYANCDSRSCLLRMVLKALTGTLERDRAFAATASPHAWIEHHRRSLYVSLDGEVVRLRPPLNYRIRPKALQVIVPRAVAPQAEAESVAAVTV